MSRPTVVIAEPIHKASTAWLAERCTVRDVQAGGGALDVALPAAEGLVVRTYTTVDAARLAQAPRLRVVGRAGVGVDNIDLDACAARGVQVVYTPDANTQAVVEYVVRLLGEALRPLHRLEGPVDADTWRHLRAEHVVRRQMNERVLGVLGAGRIGSRVAAVGRAIGLRVLFCDLEPIAIPGAEAVDVATLFGEADVITVHIDGRPANRGFVGSGLIGGMRDDVVFINTSRGFVVDEPSLAAFARAHPGACIHLDVHEREPVDAANPLVGVPNVALYPHLASRTETAMRNMSEVVRDVWAVLAGESPRWPAVRVD